MDLTPQHTGVLPQTNQQAVSFIERKAPFRSPRSGSLSFHYVARKPNRSGAEIIYVETAETYSEKQPNTIGMMQDCIVDTFDLNTTLLAEVCHVSRDTVQKWKRRNKIERQTKGMDRLYNLYIAAQNWQSMGYPSPGDKLKLPTVNGESLFDRLKAEPLNSDSITFVGSSYVLGQLDSMSVSDPFREQ